MTALGEAGVSVIALAAMLPLTLGLVSVVLVGNGQLKVHALSLAGTGPLVLLLSASAWGDWRTALTALVLSAVLLVTTGMSAHAIMRLLVAEEQRRAGPRPDQPAPGPRDGDGSG